MKSLNTVILLLVSILIAVNARAALYKWVDDQGITHYSDIAPKQNKFEDIEVKILSGGNRYSGSVDQFQGGLVADFSDSIAFGNPGQAELYFVSFAGDSKQDVFMNEALYTQKLFDAQYKTAGRSVALINNQKTTSSNLVASNENLERALKVMGKKMNDEDVLYLYLTSHGSRDHQLSVDFPPHTVKDFGAFEVRRMLDEADIKWRVIVVSACFAGGFIEPLKSPYTVIATASDSAHSSFGCSDDRDFTYYGEAIFKQQMAQGLGIMRSLQGAQGIVTQMEKASGYSASNPLLWSGAAVATKMAELERLR